MFFYVFPDVGATFALLAYVTVALGGFGNVPGTLVAGVVVGLIEVLGGLLIAPALKYAAVFADLPGRRPLAAAGPLRALLMPRRARAARRASCCWALLAGLPARLHAALPARRDDPDLPLRDAGHGLEHPGRATAARSRSATRSSSAPAPTRRRVLVRTGSASRRPWLGHGRWARSLAVAALAGHRLSRVPAARALLRHRHHRGGRDRPDARDQLGLRSGGARGLFVPIKRPDSLVNFQFHESKQTYYYIALGLLAPGLWDQPADRRAPAPATTSAPSARTRTRRRALGIPVARYKQRAMAISAALTALGGTFYAQYVFFIDPESVLPALALDPRLPGGGAGRRRDAVGAAARRRHPRPAAARSRASSSAAPARRSISSSTALLIMIVSVVQPGGIMALLQRGSPAGVR